MAAVATVFINVVVPATKAIGRGLEYRIDKAMGTPPEEPPPPSSPVSQSLEQQSIES